MFLLLENMFIEWYSAGPGDIEGSCNDETAEELRTAFGILREDASALDTWVNLEDDDDVVNALRDDIVDQVRKSLATLAILPDETVTADEPETIDDDNDGEDDDKTPAKQLCQKEYNNMMNRISDFEAYLSSFDLPEVSACLHTMRQKLLTAPVKQPVLKQRTMRDWCATK